MNILEYENYQEKKSHGSESFPYITYPCSIPLDLSGWCLPTGMMKRKLSTSKKAAD